MHAMPRARLGNALKEEIMLKMPKAYAEYI